MCKQIDFVFLFVCLFFDFFDGRVPWAQIPLNTKNKEANNERKKEQKKERTKGKKERKKEKERQVPFKFQDENLFSVCQQKRTIGKKQFRLDSAKRALRH